jgi:hypothetical protein
VWVGALIPAGGGRAARERAAAAVVAVAAGPARQKGARPGKIPRAERRRTNRKRSPRVAAAPFPAPSLFPESDDEDNGPDLFGPSSEEEAEQREEVEQEEARPRGGRRVTFEEPAAAVASGDREAESPRGLLQEQLRAAFEAVEARRRGPSADPAPVPPPPPVPPPAPARSGVAKPRRHGKAPSPAAPEEAGGGGGGGRGGWRV